MPDTHKNYATGFVTSADGATVGYRQMGTGPALILLHGGMMASQNFMKLGTLLADTFTVYIPDRRGRGLSQGYGGAYRPEQDFEDVEAMLNKTGAHFVFGLSSGAIIALESARRFSSIQKLAIYEPPLSFNGSQPDAWAGRYEKEVTQGKLAEAMVTVLKGTSDRWSIGWLPRFILVPLLRFGIEAESLKKEPDQVPIKELITTMRYDCQLLEYMRGRMENFSTVEAEVLLLGGNRSHPALKPALTGLSKVLPHSQRVELRGVGHTAADNNDKPQLVAAELSHFFTGSTKIL